MKDSPASLLILAWDEAAAPAAYLPGGAPALSLLQHLAAGQTARLVLPQLPVAEPTTAANQAANQLTPAIADKVIDLAKEFAANVLAANILKHSSASAPAALELRVPLTRQQAATQLPAAPYVGSSVEIGHLQVFLTHSPPIKENPSIAPAAELAPARKPASELTATQTTAQVSAPVIAQPLAAQSSYQPPVETSETTSASYLVESAEANDLATSSPLEELPRDLLPSSTEPEPPAAGAPLLPAAPERASLTQALAALAPPVVPAFDLSGNLQYRIIQYARFAAHFLSQQPDDFGVLYAPNWPTWLAALEMLRQRRRPLVLHLTALAAAQAAPAERGWLLELERQALRQAHTVLVASKELRRLVRKHYGTEVRRVRVVAADDEAGIQAALARVGKAAGAGPVWPAFQ